MKFSEWLIREAKVDFTKKDYGYVYHPYFNYGSSNKSKGDHGTFYVGYDGNKFVLLNSYKVGTEYGTILQFYVSMPSEDVKISSVLLFDTLNNLREIFGTSNVFNATLYNNQQLDKEDWYIVKCIHSKIPYNELVHIIENNWRENNVRFSPPMPDINNPELRDDILDTIYGTKPDDDIRSRDYANTYPSPYKFEKDPYGLQNMKKSTRDTSARKDSQSFLEI